VLERRARERPLLRQSFVRIFLLLLALSASAWASEASELYKKGRKAEKAGHIARAYLLYSEAAALDPTNHQYWSRTLALQTRAALEAKITPKIAAEAADSDAEEPAPPPQATPQDLAEAKKPLPPTELDGKQIRKDFHIKGNAKALFETVSRDYGLDCVFDGDYQATQTLRFEMDDANYREALRGLEAVTGSFIVPISSKLFLVVKDTPQKRKEEEPYAAVVIPLPEPTTTQDLTAMVTAVQQACGIQKVAWDSQKNVVVMRDTVSKVLPARALFEDLLRPRAQILFDMEFLEVDRSKMLKYGLTLPTSFPLVSFSDFLHSAPGIASNLAGMLAFGGGESLIGMGIANAQLMATLSRSDSKILVHSTARSIDGQPASMHVGQRYPILTAGYYGPSNFYGNGAYTPPPSFTFEDLGFSLKATPHVHGTDEVSLSIEAEFKVLAGAALNGIPVINNRSLKSDVRLKMGEWAVISGLIQTQDARTIAGIAGLANIPLLGPLTRNTNKTEEGQEVLILIRPTLITVPPSEMVTHVLRMGSEARPLTQM
jgi:general secretion pathway protein D